jgi:carboxyl-terminal processing protease
MARRSALEQTTARKRVPVIGVAVLVVILAGLVVDANKAEDDNFYANIIRLDNVATKVHQSYVEEVSSDELVDKAIEGMLSVLDPHTTYFQQKQYEELRIHTEGEFGGLGIQIAIRDKILTVMTPISGTPASRAGIQSGDQILEIEGESTKGITIDGAVSKLRGQPGSEVTITVRRRGERKSLKFTITREVIKIKSVPYYGMVEDNIGYIRLLTFSQDAGKETERAIKALAEQGDLKGLVLDLRFNPGGLLPQAIEVAEKFLAKKALVVSTRGRERTQNKEYYATGSPVLPLDIPLVVLVSRSSASASEIVAGAVQDWDRGVVLGDTTFGKGSVQSILTLDRTHKLKMTTAFYYTPSGRCINKPENDIRGGDDEDGEGALDADSLAADSADSGTADTAIYRTKNGRVVPGGGGIIPDTVVESEKLTPVVISLLGKDAFFKFANQEYPKLKKRGIKVDGSYVPTDEVVEDFEAFLDSMQFHYRSPAQIQFREFQERVGLVTDSSDTADSASTDGEPAIEEYELEEEELAKIKEASALVQRVLESVGERALLEERDEIRERLGESLLVRALGQDHGAVYNRQLSDDRQLAAATDILRNAKVYKELLTPDEE